MTENIDKSGLSRSVLSWVSLLEFKLVTTKVVGRQRRRSQNRDVYTVHPSLPISSMLSFHMLFILYQRVFPLYRQCLLVHLHSASSLYRRCSAFIYCFSSISECFPSISNTCLFTVFCQKPNHVANVHPKAFATPIVPCSPSSES